MARTPAPREPNSSHSRHTNCMCRSCPAPSLAALTGTDEVNVTYRDLYVPVSTGNGLFDYFGWYYLMISEGLIDNLEFAY